jgi:hypothetical protein
MAAARAALVKAAALQDPLQQKLAVIAAITKTLEPFGIRPIVIGGLAVAFYTLGGYATEDVDLAVVGREQFAETMAHLGFAREGRYWTHALFAFPIEAPAGALPGEDAPLTQLMVDGWPVYILGIEDLIVDRLNAYVHWHSVADGEWVLQLLRTHAAEIDWGYLAARAGATGTLDALNSLRTEKP